MATWREATMPYARYFVVRQQDVWLIKFDDEEYGPYRSQGEAMLFAIDAAQKLGLQGESAEVALMGENGHFRSEWIFGRDPYPPRNLASHMKPKAEMTRSLRGKKWLEDSIPLRLFHRGVQNCCDSRSMNAYRQFWLITGHPEERGTYPYGFQVSEYATQDLSGTEQLNRRAVSRNCERR